MASTPIGAGMYDPRTDRSDHRKAGGRHRPRAGQGGVARAGAGTTTLTVDTYNAQALAIYAAVASTCILVRSPSASGRGDAFIDTTQYPGLAVRRAVAGDLVACVALAQSCANTDMSSEIRAHAETTWVVTGRPHDVVIGYCAALDMSGHSVFAEMAPRKRCSVPRRPLERPMVCVNLAANREFARWMFENGWRVVRGLLMSNRVRGARAAARWSCRGASPAPRRAIFRRTSHRQTAAAGPSPGAAAAPPASAACALPRRWRTCQTHYRRCTTSAVPCS